MDRWFHIGFLVYLPTDVDLQTGVRRIWPIDRPQKMFLDFGSVVVILLVPVFDKLENN